ncbi:hypothetical protein CIL05_07140 [Virgibacillus profundi]|uniref:Uncharacterized protein n=1 Tax=Virgibacillus profundi TaxID=2024555 RepID=A0A2A2IGI0_9BACI|nr:hypothetical protein [Virgibacillus profundi]PAV30235.1 hypothetical protein CIL05_07140 [Virgibacillus profundi]PXY54407.1 hypothetical protein CIT14_07225 [Virgibacillus profundi]
MVDTFKVNQCRKQSAKEIGTALNECNMLFKCDIEDQANKIVFHIITDSVDIQYTELDNKRMDNFLSVLKDFVVNKEDIEELKEELLVV